MAQRIDEAKYEAMISALYAFASNVYNAASEMQTLASVCVQAIGDEDKAVASIYEQIKESQLKYEEATSQARSIAGKMQEELEEQRREDQVWSGADS